MSEQPPACPALPENMSLEELEPTYQAIAAAQARLIAKGSCLDGLYSVGILLQYIAVIKAQITGLKDELAEQEKQKLTLLRELEASEKYRHLLTKAILHSTNAPPAPKITLLNTSRPLDSDEYDVLTNLCDQIALGNSPEPAP